MGNRRVTSKKQAGDADLVQLKNPRSNCYVLVDRNKGVIVFEGGRRRKPYKNVPIVGKVDPDDLKIACNKKKTL